MSTTKQHILSYVCLSGNASSTHFAHSNAQPQTQKIYFSRHMNLSATAHKHIRQQHTHSTSLTQHTNIYDWGIHTQTYTLTSPTHEILPRRKKTRCCRPEPGSLECPPAPVSTFRALQMHASGAADLIACVGARVSELVGRVVECVPFACVLAATHACVKCVHAEHVSKCIRDAFVLVRFRRKNVNARVYACANAPMQGRRRGEKG